MNKSFRLILWTCVLFLSLWMFAEWFEGHRDSYYTHKYSQVYGNPAITTLFMGSSYLENCMNPHLLQDNDSIYDFAISGRWIYWDVQLAERIFPTMSNLKTVIFPIGYEAVYSSYHYQPCNPENELYMYKYSKYMNIYYDRLPQRFTCRSALYMNQLRHKKWKDITYDSLGYYPIVGKSPKWEMSVKRNIHRSWPAQECYREYLNYLTDFAQICHQNGIRLIAITFPCADYYLENIQPEGVQDLYALIDSVQSHYPIEYHNYLYDDEFRADSIYYNANHLNSIGATLFARRVRKDFNL